MTKSGKAGTTTWVDLTDFLSWEGHFTGIQRVVYSYAIRFAMDGARFIVYDAVGTRYVEVSADFLQSLQQSDEGKSRQSLKHRLKSAAKKPYQRLPEDIKVYIRPMLHASGEVTHTFLDRVVYKNKAARSVFVGYPDADLQRGDKVVLVGAGWNEEDALEALCKIKQDVGVRIIQHINDILPIYQPQLFADELPRIFTPYIDLALRNADIVTVISEATKRDVEIFCKERGIAAPHIKVVRLGEDLEQYNPVKPKGFSAQNAFILSVGTFEVRKNYLLLYQAAKLAQLEGKAIPDIIIVGRKGWLTEDLAHVIERDPLTQNKIHWLKKVSDSELEWLYEHCMFTVFPSLCEGWGLPIVESLQHGRMCLTSNVSAMLEVGDGIVDYFSPYDARSCMEKILQYAKAKHYQEVNERIERQHIAYTWDESYKSFVAALALRT